YYLTSDDFEQVLAILRLLSYYHLQQLIFSYIPPLKPLHLYYTSYYLIYKSQKIFGAKKHQKF
ncbi:hypothetical protein DW207_16410, partial [Mediterraneibacter gnavus]